MDNSGGGALTNYQVKVTLTNANFDFSKAKADGSDIRFTNSDATTLISYWTESYDSVGETAVIWPKIPSIPAGATYTTYMYYGSTDDYIKLSVDQTTHDDYGLSLPVTYEFDIPAGSADLKAYKRYAVGEAWGSPIDEYTTADYFNGIEAVRFDYTANKAYVSVAFSTDSNDIHLRITDSSDDSVAVTYQGISDYYDNRTAAVVATGDDWDGAVGNDTPFINASDAFQLRNMWFTPGVVANGTRMFNKPAPIWANIQTQIDEGYVEVANHGYEHLQNQDITPNMYFYRYTGTHTAVDSSSTILTTSDSSHPFPVDNAPYTANLNGWVIDNTTDGSSCTITSSNATTATCAGGLSGGTDNTWVTGDAWVIDRYDEEIGDSKSVILANLDLPAQYKKGVQEYLYAWLEPNGYSDATVRAKLGEYLYLADRDTTTTVNTSNYSDWDEINKVFDRIGASYQMDPSAHPALTGEQIKTEANAKFDAVKAVGGVYHMFFHPSAFKIGSPWTTPGSWLLNHLDYVSGKNDVWYAGFGYLHLYRYLDTNNKVTMTGVSDGAIGYPEIITDNFSGTTLDTDIWTKEIHIGNGTVSVADGNVTLDTQTLITNSAGIKSNTIGVKRVKARLKASSTPLYMDMSIGSGHVVPKDGPAQWWHTTFQNGYVFHIQNNTTAVLSKEVNSSNTVLATYATALDITNFHNYELIISDTGVSVERDGVTIMSSADKTYSSGSALIVAGNYVGTDKPPIIADWVELRKQYPNPGLITTVETEEQRATPANQDAVFPGSVIKQGGQAVTIVSSGDATNNVWFAPVGTTVFAEGTNMTKAANGVAETILAPADEGDYNLFVLNQYDDVSAPSTATLTVDDTGPSGTVSINEALTKDAVIQLILNATDVDTTVTDMRFSNDGATWSGWEAYGQNKSWDITDVTFGGTSSQGEKTVYAQFKDSVGNLSAIVNDTVIYDTSPTYGNLPGTTEQVDPSEGQLITTNPYIIKVKPDSVAGIEKVEFLVDDALICTETVADANGVYGCSWDTARYQGTIRIIVYDIYGATTTITRDVTVDPALYTIVLPQTGKR